MGIQVRRDADVVVDECGTGLGTFGARRPGSGPVWRSEDMSAKVLGFSLVYADALEDALQGPEVPSLASSR